MTHDGPFGKGERDNRVRNLVIAFIVTDILFFAAVGLYFLTWR